MASASDLRLDDVLPRQHGAFSRAQAARCGFTPSMIKSRLTAQRWREVDQGVYAHATYRHSWEQRCVAAVLAEPYAVLGGKTSAVVHGCPDFRKGGIELTVPPHAGHPSRLARVRRSTLIEPCRVGPFTVNSMALTLIELAGRISYDRLDRAFEHAILHRLLTMDTMVEWYVRIAKSRRPGLPALRVMLDHRGSGFVPAESELEAKLLHALRHPGIPAVTRQAPFPWSPGGKERVDAYIESWRMLIEADGRRWHARLETWSDDLRRDQEAVRHGYLPLRFCWADLVGGPDHVRSVVMDAGRHRVAAGITGTTGQAERRGRARAAA